MGATTTNPNTKVTADEIRAYVVAEFLEPARREGRHSFTVRIGDLMAALRGIRGVSHPCNALRSETLFQRPNGIELIEDRGPASTFGYNVWLTFRIDATRPAATAAPAAGNRDRSDARAFIDTLLALRGVGSDAYRRHGGGDAVLAKVREGWS